MALEGQAAPAEEIKEIRRLRLESPELSRLMMWREQGKTRCARRGNGARLPPRRWLIGA
jgi:hypothetical protein